MRFLLKKSVSCYNNTWNCVSHVAWSSYCYFFFFLVKFLITHRTHKEIFVKSFVLLVFVFLFCSSSSNLHFLFPPSTLHSVPSSSLMRNNWLLVNWSRKRRKSNQSVQNSIFVPAAARWRSVKICIKSLKYKNIVWIWVQFMRNLLR